MTSLEYRLGKTNEGDLSQRYIHGFFNPEINYLPGISIAVGKKVNYPLSEIELNYLAANFSIEAFAPLEGSKEAEIFFGGYKIRYHSPNNIEHVTTIVSHRQFRVKFFWQKGESYIGSVSPNQELLQVSSFAEFNNSIGYFQIGNITRRTDGDHPILRDSIVGQVSEEFHKDNIIEKYPLINANDCFIIDDPVYYNTINFRLRLGRRLNEKIFQSEIELPEGEASLSFVSKMGKSSESRLSSKKIYIPGVNSDEDIKSIKYTYDRDTIFVPEFMK